MAKSNSAKLAIVRVPDGSDRLSPAELASLTPSLLGERVREMLPYVADHASEAERQRRPVDGVMERLRRAGVFYHFVPKVYGGLEFGVMDFVDNMMPLAEACASTCWVTTFCMEHNLLLALFSEEAQKEIFGTQGYMIAPGSAMPPGKAVRVPGGFRVSGHWRFGSGIMHADWVMAVVTVEGSDPIEPRWIVAPVGDVTVLDVWQMDGLAGTGSNDFVMDDVFVPEHRTLKMAEMQTATSPGARMHTNPIYRMAITSFLTLTSAIPVIGAARGAVNAFRSSLTDRVSVGVKQVDRTALQMALGLADTEVRFTELALRDAVRSLMALAERGDSANIEARAQIRVQIATATSLAKEAVRRVVDVMGTAVHQLNNPIQRALRDITVATGHIVHDRAAATELRGRLLLGLPPQQTLV